MTGRLERKSDGAVIAGVCAGLGAHLQIDPVLVRIVFVLLAVTGGAGILLYLLCWMIIPEAARAAADDGAPAREAPQGASRPALGFLLIAIGGLLLLERFSPFDVEKALRLWPVLLVAAGLWILLRPRPGTP